MQKTKILFISSAMPLGGGSTSILNLCDGLKSEGTWEPHVAVIDSLGYIGEQIKQRGHHVHGPCHGVLHEDRILKLIDLCRRIKPSVIVAALGGSSFDFLRYAPMGCLRISMIQSDDSQVYDQANAYAFATDIVVGVSSEICRKARESLPRAETQISYQPYGVPLPENPKPPTRTEALRVLYLGRVCEDQKRMSVMARVIAKTLESKQPIHWTIAGDGESLPELKSRFAAYSDKVAFAGHVAYDAVPEIFSRHDVYFLCSEFEGLPLSLLEAMGSGLVPVVSDLPSGISEVINDHNGFRVPITDELEYAEALQRLALNPEMLAEMSIASVDAVKCDFSVQAMTNRWLKLLNTCKVPTHVDWTTAPSIMPPLKHRNSILYRPILRPLRRLLKNLSR